jgi:hypothetical protein
LTAGDHEQREPPALYDISQLQEPASSSIPFVRERKRALFHMNQSQATGVRERLHICNHRRLYFFGFHSVFAFMKREAKAGVRKWEEGAASVRYRRRDAGGDQSSPLVMITIPLSARPHLQPHYGYNALRRENRIALQDAADRRL